MHCGEVSGRSVETATAFEERKLSEGRNGTACEKAVAGRGRLDHRTKKVTIAITSRENMWVSERVRGSLFPPKDRKESN